MAHVTPELYRSRDVCATLGIARSTLYELIKTDGFPQPVRVSKRAVRWRRIDVEEWARSRPAARRRR